MTRIVAALMLAAVVSPLLSPTADVALRPARSDAGHPPGCPWRDSAGPCPHGSHPDAPPASGPRLVACDDGVPSLLPPPDLRLVPPVIVPGAAPPPVVARRPFLAGAGAGIEPPPPISPPPRRSPRA